MQLSNFKIIRQALASMYKGDITSEQAEKLIESRIPVNELAEFVVDVFNRGWVTKENLGINEDGDLI